MNIVFEIKGEINKQTYKEYLRVIKGATSIHFKIDSCGGFVVYADKIIDHAIGLNIPIVTEQVGNVMSAASKIFAIGHERKVNNSKGKNVMIHLPRISFEKEVITSKGIRVLSDLMDKIEDGFLDVYSKVINLSKEKIKDMMEKETFLSNQEAFDMGLATEIKNSYMITASGKSVLKLEMEEEEKEERLVSRILNVLEKRSEAVKAEAELLELKQESGNKDQIIIDLKAKLEDALEMVNSLSGEVKTKELENNEITAKFTESKELLAEALEKIQAQRTPLVTDVLTKEVVASKEYTPMKRVPFNPYN
jgi:ATP-dependent protease ClpP protease subunit